MSLREEFRQAFPSEEELILAEERIAHKQSRRVSSRRKVLVAGFAAVVFVILLVAALLIHYRAPLETAVVDLRNVTRGLDTSSASDIAIHRDARHLRILLSTQHALGQYEVGVFDPANQTSPLMTSPASSTREGDSVVLEAPLALKNLRPGPYLLGIRQDQSDWVYYAIRIE